MSRASTGDEKVTLAKAVLPIIRPSTPTALDASGGKTQHAGHAGDAQNYLFAGFKVYPTDNKRKFAT
jgi:hypothetical protein